MGEAKKDSTVSNRLISGGLLVVLGLVLVVSTDGLGIGLGIVCLIGAAYQLVTAAVAQGTHEGRHR